MALLEVKNLFKEYPIYRGVLRKKVGAVFALNGIDLSIEEGQFVAVVGESGCGKSTLTKAVIRLIQPTAPRAKRKLAFASFSYIEFGFGNKNVKFEVVYVILLSD